MRKDTLPGIVLNDAIATLDRLAGLGDTLDRRPLVLARRCRADLFPDAELAGLLS